MERNIKRVGFLLAAGALLLSGVVAQQVNRNNTISGPVDTEEYFVESVFFQGVKLPEILDSSSGSSSYELEGSGSVTVGSSRSGGFPRVVILGGTTITSTREHGEENVNHEWWEGEFFAPSNGRTSVEVDGTDSPNGDDIARYIVEGSYEFGGTKEEFSFSPSATFVADFEGALPDNTRLFVATKDIETEEQVYTLNSEEYCWIEDGFCIVDISTAGSFVLVREVFERCPTRNEVLNGFIGSVPNCLLNCSRGYEPDEDRRYCVASEGTTGQEEGGEFIEEESGEEQNYVPEQSFEPSAYEYRPGYFKYRGTREHYDRELNTEGLVGEDKRRAEKLSVGSPKTVGYRQTGSGSSQSAAEENDSFLNYLLSFRGKGGQQANIFTADAGSEEMGNMEDGNNDEGGTYSSAPLLPSTGAAGIFWVLAALGLGMMAFAVKRK